MRVEVAVGGERAEGEGRGKERGEESTCRVWFVFCVCTLTSLVSFYVACYKQPWPTDMSSKQAGGGR